VKTFLLALLVVVVAVTAGCGASTIASPARTTAIARNDLFQQHTIATTDKAAVVRATSLLGSQTIDTTVLAQLIRQRLGQVEADALKDLLTSANTSSEPMEDLLDAIAGLVVSTSDGQTKSQALVAALVRDGLSFGLAQLARMHILPSGSCEATELDTAAYEGLAASTFLRSLGFPFATGNVTKDCHDFAQSVSLLADGAGTLPSGAKATALTAAIGNAVDSCKDDTRPIKETLTALGNNPTVSDVRKAAVAAVDVAYSGVAALAAPVKCNASLIAFASAYDAALGGVASRLDDKTTLAEVTTARSAVVSFARREPGKPFTEVAADGGNPAAPAATASDAGVTACVIDGGVPPNAATLLTDVQAISIALVNQTPLTRGDVVTLTKSLEAFVDCYVSAELPREVLDAFLAAVPDSIKEDTGSSAGIDMDVPALVTNMVARFDASYSAGWYLRATIGAGYVYQPLPGGNSERNAAPAYYEELGFGRRCYGAGGIFSWSDGHCAPSKAQAILHGFQVVTSGLLFQISSATETQNALFFGGGYSVNFYRLLDVSVNLGALVDTKESNTRFATMVGLQLPIFDYLSALTSSTSVDAQTKSSK
jgi:hypothetical protein